MRIGVLMGGIAAEREVSINTGTAIFNSLKRMNYDVIKIILDKENLLNAIIDSNIDFAFLALHGEYGEDGRIQSVLDILKIPYTGSGYEASAVAMNKNITKMILNNYNVLSPKSYEKISDIDKYPVVIKPATEGSSFGLYICNNLLEAEKAINNLKGLELVIEEFVSGEELTCGVLNGEALGVLKIVPKSGVYDYESKYTKGATNYEYPAKIEDSLYKECMEISELVHDKLNLRGATRSDFILSNGKLYFLEVNTCPGMTETSLLPKIATLKSYDFDQLVQKILGDIEKYKKR